MFGKRTKNPPQTDDFEGAEADYVEDFTSANIGDDNAFTPADPDDGQGWEDASLPQEDDPIEPELRDTRRSPLAKLLPFAAVGVLAAGGAGYYYLNYMQAPVTAAAPVVAETPAEATPVVAGEPASQIPETAGIATPATEAMGESAPAIIAQAAPVASEAQEDSVAAPPTEIENQVAAVTSPSQISEEAPVASAPAPAPVEATPVPVMETPKPAAVADAAVPVPDQAAAPVKTTAPTPASGNGQANASAPTANDEKLADLSERMEVLEQQIEDLTKSLDRVATAQTAAARPAPVDVELSKTVTNLQDQVRKLQADLAAANKARQVAPAATPPAASTPTPAPVATRSAPRPTSTPTETKTPAAPAAQATPAPVRWVLRAAQSNEAWISRSAEGELKSVSVGDTVQGLGRITAIRQTATGGWEILGTQASIRQ